MFKHEDVVYIIKRISGEEYFRETSTHNWDFVDNIMEAKYFPSRVAAEKTIGDYTYLDDTKSDYEIIKMRYEFHWSWVEE